MRCVGGVGVGVVPPNLTSLYLTLPYFPFFNAAHVWDLASHFRIIMWYTLLVLVVYWRIEQDHAGVTLIEIYPNLFVGSEADYEEVVKGQSGWSVVQACKEPYHRQALGYKGKAAPSTHPEYLVARRDNRLILNLVDVEDPAYVSSVIMDAALEFIESRLAAGDKVLVHCNQGESRGPSIGLLYLVSRTDTYLYMGLDEADEAFKTIYPKYKPKGGMHGFLKLKWDKYCKMAQ